MVVFVRDKRGAATIQVVLLLPVLALLLLGAYEVWKVLHVQQTLNDAAYQGVRMLALRPNADGIGGETEDLVYRYVSVNPLINEDLVTVNVNNDYVMCGDVVSVEVLLYWTAGHGSGYPDWAGFLRLRGNLRGYASGQVICDFRD